MSVWTSAMDRILVLTQQQFGQVTTFMRDGALDFQIIGIPSFIDRLEDPSSGPFYSIYYRVKDFDAAPFTASVTVTFRNPPNAGGTLTFDGITYHSEQTIDDTQPNQFWRAGSAYAAAVDLAHAIMADPVYASSDYSASTVAHPTCTAVAEDNGDGTAVTIVSYKTPGIVGDSVRAEDAMTFASLSSKIFTGGLPLINDLVLLENTLYRVSDVPETDTEGGIQIRLEKKAL